MDFREASEIARRNPGARVTRGSDGGFVVLLEDGSPFPSQNSAENETERLLRDCDLLRRQSDELRAELEEERSSQRREEAALNAIVQQLQFQLQFADQASKEALSSANKTIEQLKAKMSLVSAEEWERIKVCEKTDREDHARELRKERRTQSCPCQGEVENCARCDGKGIYTVDGFGNPVFE